MSEWCSDTLTTFTIANRACIFIRSQLHVFSSIWIIFQVFDGKRLRVEVLVVVALLGYDLGIGGTLIELQVVELDLADVSICHIWAYFFLSHLVALTYDLLSLLLIRQLLVACFLTGIRNQIRYLKHLSRLS